MLGQVEIVAVGSELLSPERADTNSPWMNSRLEELGYQVTARTILGDDLVRLADGFRLALKHCNWLIVCGGLGPTEDDRTRQAMAEALDVPLNHQEDLWQALILRFQQWGRPIPENNRRQALLLEGATALPNPTGTAPGQIWRSAKGGVVLLPGPPRELQPMFLNHLVPILRHSSQPQILLRRLYRVIGMGESALDELLQPLYPRFPEVQVTTLFTSLDLEVQLLCRASTLEAAEKSLSKFEDLLIEVLGDSVYSRSGQSLAEVVVRRLHSLGACLVTVESLTGGLLASRLTDVPGASQVYPGGWVTYSDAQKVSLGVTPQLLAEHGAVSAAVAAAMAEAGRDQADADYALALTGWAGPEGGTEADPVGTVYIGLASRHQVESRRFRFPGDRELIRSRAAQAALDWLRRGLVKG